MLSVWLCSLFEHDIPAHDLYPLACVIANMPALSPLLQGALDPYVASSEALMSSKREVTQRVLQAMGQTAAEVSGEHDEHNA